MVALACPRSARLRNFDTAPPSLMASPTTMKAVSSVFQHGCHVTLFRAVAVDQELSFRSVFIIAQAIQGPCHAEHRLQGERRIANIASKGGYATNLAGCTLYIRITRASAGLEPNPGWVIIHILAYLQAYLTPSGYRW
jgi:hypothetical protein